MVKVPFLFNHFNDHKNENSEITFINFLFQHYIQESDGSLHDSDFAEDSKLPFKADENIHVHFPPYILVALKIGTLMIPENIIFIEFNYIPVYSFSPQIWQPPRLI